MDAFHQTIFATVFGVIVAEFYPKGDISHTWDKDLWSPLCPPSTDSCYWVSPFDTNYDDAQYLCQCQNLHLVFVESKEEADALNKELRKEIGDNEYWLGMELYFGEWYWMSDYYDDSTVSWSDWTSVASHDDGRYAHARTGGKWHKARMHDRARVVCEDDGYYGSWPEGEASGSNPDTGTASAPPHSVGSDTFLKGDEKCVHGTCFQKTAKGMYYVLMRSQKRSLLECAVLCTGGRLCQAFIFRRPTNRCVMLTMGETEASAISCDRNECYRRLTDSE